MANVEEILDKKIGLMKRQPKFNSSSVTFPYNLISYEDILSKTNFKR